MSYRYSDETIHIDNLRVDCIIGVHPRERETEQPLLITLSFPADFSHAAEAESLEHTVNYSRVGQEVRAFARAGRYHLLETLARRLGGHLCERFGLPRLTLHIRKPNAIAGCDGPAVSLTVVRE